MPSSSQHHFAYDPSAVVEPRQYQATILNALRQRVSERTPSRVLVEVATGGGKTLIATDFIYDQASAGKRVLVVTMAWHIARQNALDLCRRHDGARELVGYVGKGGRHAMDGLPRTVNRQIVFTTIQTYARSTHVFANANFDLVIVDEVHWGEGRPMYDALADQYPTATFVGLTATPRRWSDYERVEPRVRLEDLIASGVLPPARVHTVRTEVNWRARQTSDHGDIAVSSLRELGERDLRNQLVVRTYAENQVVFGKTIVFACNIAHANKLEEMFRAANIKSSALHSKLRTDERLRVENSFRRGDLDVLVNVLSAVHGVDVPDVQSVFLVRPTLSDVLMSQMIGRAVRHSPGKQCFHVVDFVDNVENLGVPVLRPDGFVGSRHVAGARGPRLTSHAYEPGALEPFPLVAGYEPIAGFPVHISQTFGIEFEITRPGRIPAGREWNRVATALRSKLAAVVPTAEAGGATDDHSVWNVKSDATCGWEVTTRILRGVDGFIEAFDGARTLEQAATELGLIVDRRTGTHVHMAWCRTAPALKHLVEIAGKFEPALLSIVAPSRFNNPYARSLRPHVRPTQRLDGIRDWRRYLRNGGTRYLAVSPHGLFFGQGTVEVRLHHGTLSGGKILGWTSLWMLILSAAAMVRPLPSNWPKRVMRSPLLARRQGDLLELTRFLEAPSALDEWIRVRRHEVLTASWQRARPHAEVAGRVLAYLDRRQAHERARVGAAG